MVFVFVGVEGAFAQENANVIQQNITNSITDLPGLVSAAAYIFGIIFGVFGIIKLKQHVENPSQNPLGQALIRLSVGGGLFALPLIYEAAATTINAGQAANVAGLQDNLDEISGGGGGGGQNELNNLVINIIDSTSLIPSFAIALAYLFGLILVITALLKFKESIDVGSGQAAASQSALRAGIVRLVVGGMLFAVPTILVAIDTTFSGGTTALDFDNAGTTDALSGILGLGGAIGGTADLNNILANIIDASDQLPGAVSALAYVLGVLFGIIGILKIREHVENPDQVTLKEPVIRILVAGAFLGLPAVLNAMYSTVNSGNGDLLGFVTDLGNIGSFFRSSYAEANCDAVGTGLSALGLGGSAGNLICAIPLRAGFLPAFFNAAAYLMGLVMAVWGILKIRDHVLNPTQTKLWEGVSRLLAGGLFLALPFALIVVQNTFVPGSLTGSGLLRGAVTSYNSDINVGSACAPSGVAGLDQVIGCFMADMMVPLHTVLNFFAFVAGIIFVMIGISRLIKSAQDGARGPGGLGTILTFGIGGMLMSFNAIMIAISTTLFGGTVFNSGTKTYAQVSYMDGMNTAEVAATHNVITAVIQFMIIVGLYSFVRGLFIVRNVAEGNQQASIMAGLTHIIGGALAVNLGPLINAVQATLGIDAAQYGIVFS